MNKDKKDRWEYIICQLEAIRQEKGITQKQICNQLNLKQPNVAKFFGCEIRPNLESIFNIADVLGVEIILKDKSGDIDMIKINELAKNKIDLLIIKKRIAKINDVLS